MLPLLPDKTVDHVMGNLRNGQQWYDQCQGRFAECYRELME